VARGTVKYIAVRDHLRRRLQDMSAGEQIPTEPQLCTEYNVSRVTVRRAVDELISSGLLERVQGKGTFVTEPHYTEEIHETFADRVTGFYRQQAELGREVVTEVLRNEVTRVASAAEALELNPADELILLERLRFINGTLHQHVVTYLSATRFPAVLAHDFSHGSLFEFLEERYEVILNRNDLLVRLDTTDAHLAPLLGTEVGESVLAIDSTVFTSDGTPVAFGVATHTPAYSQIAFSMQNVGIG
jgi:DNA-binding GntR family transcriptional regulator